MVESVRCKAVLSVVEISSPNQLHTLLNLRICLLSQKWLELTYGYVLINAGETCSIRLI